MSGYIIFNISIFWINIILCKVQWDGHNICYVYIPLGFCEWHLYTCLEDIYKKNKFILMPLQWHNVRLTLYKSFFLTKIDFSCFQIYFQGWIYKTLFRMNRENVETVRQMQLTTIKIECLNIDMRVETEPRNIVETPRWRNIQRFEGIFSDLKCMRLVANIL